MSKAFRNRLSIESFAKEENIFTSLAQEMIDFQLKDQFGPNIEAIIADIFEMIKARVGYAHIVKDPIIARLEKLVFQRLGLKIKLKIDTYNFAAIIPFYANESHIFLDEYWRDEGTGLKDQEKLLRQVEDFHGFVDVHKAKVGGVFSEAINIVYMNFKDMYNDGLSPAEATAILLHELGHGFYACEYANRIDSNNQVMAGLVRHLTDKNTKRNPDYIYKQVSKIDKTFTKQAAEKIADGDNIILTRTAFKLTGLTNKAQLENSKYDETAFESLADNFAARFNYGNALATALNKLDSKYDMTGSWKYAIRYILTWGIFNVVMGGVLLSIGAAIGVFAILIGMLFVSLVWIASGEANKDYTYDESKFRYRRIRFQLIELVKQGDLPKEQLTQLVQEIDQLDKLVSKTEKYRSNIDNFKNFFFKEDRQAKSSIEEQQRWEALISNDIFVQATKMQMNAA